ncbi:hypothetical protein CDD83_2861 [Cordyceps sp. RAO-2017]|nr:hypothetical protein CDD83_2861 [Cordyceps sp. RAO-2017]
MTRRADRELPDIQQVGFRWWRTLPLFVGLVAASALAIFNYQKTTSPIVASTLYALRTSPRARARLGDDIYFRRAVPWIAGEMNQLRGRVDVRFGVRGSAGAATMRFVSRRPGPRALFETLEWSLTMDDDGEWVDLLEGAGADPFRALLADDDEPPPLGAPPGTPPHEAPSTRGFRQQGALNK